MLQPSQPKKKHTPAGEEHLGQGFYQAAALVCLKWTFFRKIWEREDLPMMRPFPASLLATSMWDLAVLGLGVEG